MNLLLEHGKSNGTSLLLGRMVRDLGFSARSALRSAPRSRVKFNRCRGSRSRGRIIRCNIGALIIRIGFRGMLNCTRIIIRKPKIVL